MQHGRRARLQHRPRRGDQRGLQGASSTRPRRRPRCRGRAGATRPTAPQHPAMGVNFEWAPAYCVVPGQAAARPRPSGRSPAAGADGRLYPWGNDLAAVPARPAPTPTRWARGGQHEPPRRLRPGRQRVGVGSDPYDKRVQGERAGAAGWPERLAAQERRPGCPSIPRPPTPSRSPASAARPPRSTPPAPACSSVSTRSPPPPVAPKPKPLPDGVLTDDDFRRRHVGLGGEEHRQVPLRLPPQRVLPPGDEGRRTSESLALGPVVPEPGKLVSVRHHRLRRAQPTPTPGGTFDYGLAFRMDGQGRGLVFVVSPRDLGLAVCERNADGTYWLIAAGQPQRPRRSSISRSA